MSEHRVYILVNGTLTDPTSITTGNEDDEYGIRRLDTLDSVVAADQAYTKISKGYYKYVFSDPTTGLTYGWSTTVVNAGSTYYIEGTMPEGIFTVNVVLPDVNNHFTSQAEVLRVMGTMAETLLMDDFPGSNSRATAWEDLLSEADETISMYVMQHYDPATLYSNTWIRRRATYLVAHALSGRRGSPGLYSSRVDTIYSELDDVRNGRHHIPGATTFRHQGPIIRTYITQQRFWTHPNRVILSKSTSAGNYGNENVAIEPFIYYSSVL